MPFAILSFAATDNLLLSKFVLSCPQALKDWLEECLCIDAATVAAARIDNGQGGGIPENSSVRAVGSGDSSPEEEPVSEYYAIWNGNSCVLSKGYLVDVHELLNIIEQNGWKIDQFSTSLTGAGVQCQTYVFRSDDLE